MPGRSGRFPRIALVVAVVAVVGSAASGWAFADGASNPAAFAVALVAVALAGIATVRDRG